MIKARYILIFVLCSVFLVLWGCRPKGVLSSSAMKEVLEDLHKTEAMLQTAGLKPSDQEIKSIYYAQVLERHGVTQAELTPPSFGTPPIRNSSIRSIPK